MLGKFNIREKEGINDAVWHHIVTILVQKGNLKRDFILKNKKDLNADELTEILTAFEKNYEKIKTFFKNGEYDFPATFEEFKDIRLGICQKKYREYKNQLFDELAQNKKKEFTQHIDQRKFMYLCSETSTATRNFILSRVSDRKEFAQTINNMDHERLQKFFQIINAVNNNRKIFIMIEQLGKDFGEIINGYEKDTIVLLLKKMDEKNIKEFFSTKYGNNHFDITHYCNHIEKMIEIVLYLGAETFILTTKEIESKLLGALIDRTTVKELGKNLLKKEVTDQRKNGKPIKDIIQELNQEVFKK